MSRIDSETKTFAFLAGGTDIMPYVNGNIFDKEIVFDLSPFYETLHFVEVQENGVEIGALVSLTEIIEKRIIIEKIPQLVEAIENIGSKQIKNMGTLVGNIANASPIGDSAPVLMTKMAKIKALSVTGERIIEMENFFVDYKKTSLHNNEIIKSVYIPFNNIGGVYGFRKVAMHPDMAISKINFAYAIENNNVRLAAGGVAKTPVRLKNIEKNWGKILGVDECKKILAMDCNPITDLRSTADYRKRVLVNFIVELSQSSQE